MSAAPVPWLLTDEVRVYPLGGTSWHLQAQLLSVWHASGLLPASDVWSPSPSLAFPSSFPASDVAGVLTPWPRLDVAPSHLYPQISSTVSISWLLPN